MAQTPLTVNIGLHNLLMLLNYYWASVNSDRVGDLGNKTYEETIIEIEKNSTFKVTPSQLESLVFHMKQAIFEKIKPIHTDNRLKSYHQIMRNLKEEIPQLFKELPSGEISFIDFKERENDR